MIFWYVFFVSLSLFAFCFYLEKKASKAKELKGRSFDLDAAEREWGEEGAERLRKVWAEEESIPPTPSTPSKSPEPSPEISFHYNKTINDLLQKVRLFDPQLALALNKEMRRYMGEEVVAEEKSWPVEDFDPRGRASQSAQELMFQHELESQREQARAVKVLYPRLRKANKEDYRKWLEGYRKRGGRVDRNSSSRPFQDSSRWYVALGNLEPVSLCGSRSLKIIVPEGVDVGFLESEPFEGWGHTNFFYMEGFRSSRGDAPTFSDVG